MGILELFDKHDIGPWLKSLPDADFAALTALHVNKNGKDYFQCPVRKKDIVAKPEECVRQYWIFKLTKQSAYPLNRLAVEYPITFGRDSSKRADIVVFDADRPTVPYIVIEVKQGKQKDGKEQLRSYTHATGAPLALWSNGPESVVWHRKNPNYFVPIPHLPSANQDIDQVVDEPWTLKTLEDKENERAQSASGNKALREKIVDLEDEVLANAGVDVFEEVFKLVFTKLYDEMSCHQGRYKFLRFRNSNTSTKLKSNIQDLFDEAKKEWPGVFSDDERIRLSADHLQVCVGSLEEWKLFNSNLDVVDDAFEYLVSKSAKGEKGQYFTPRWVIDMCVKMLNPQESETVIDTACGSAGFTVHAMFHVWKQILDDLKLPQSQLFTAERKPQRCLDYVGNKVFALDFDEKSVRVSRCLNLIAGDGQTNVLHLNTLDWTKWEETVKQDEWQETYGPGWTKLKKQRADKKQTDYRRFGFDICMANPPFAGDIKQTDMLAPYVTAQKANGKYETAVARDLLFIERNLDFLKPGGRMAIVLPQGRFNNTGDERLQRFIMDQCRILAVVGLHPNTFKPHTNTKTSVLFVQKWNDDATVGSICPRVDDYDIFFASQRVESVNNSGEKVYVKSNDGSFQRDSHGHFIVSHDLFNHDGKTNDGIAEAYIAFAKNNLKRTTQVTNPKNAQVTVSASDILSETKWRTTDALWYFALASEIVTAGRMDAQFFHPKFKEIQARLEATGRCVTLSTALSLNVRGRQPQYADVGIPVINSKHVRANRVVLDYDNRFAIEAGSPVAIQNGDVLLNGTGVGTIGRTAPYLHEEKALPDNHVTVLRTKTIDPIYLSVFMNSSLGQMQIERHIRGSSGQIEIYPYDIAKIVVWDAPIETQKKIRAAILSAFDQERRANELLDRAKRAVEFAIEENEEAALRFLDEAGA